MDWSKIREELECQSDNVEVVAEERDTAEAREAARLIGNMIRSYIRAKNEQVEEVACSGQ